MQRIYSNMLFQASFGGVIGGLSLSGLNFGWVSMPISIAFLWHSARNPIASFLWGFFAVLISHFWLLALHPLSWLGINDVISCLIVIGLLIICSSFGGFLVYIWSKIVDCFWERLDRRGSFRKTFYVVIVCSCIWGLVEVILSQSPFFWVGLGVSFLPGDVYFAGISRWIGGSGLSAAQLIIGWWLLQIFLNFKKHVLPKKLIFFGLISLLSIHLIGWHNLSNYNNKLPSFSIATWQSNIPIRKKFTEGYFQRMNELIRQPLIKSKALGAELLIAPEGSMPANYELNDPASLDFLTGGFRWVDGRQRSSLLLFKEGESKFSNYLDKHRLVPLGERVPSFFNMNFHGLAALGGLEPGEYKRFFNWRDKPFAGAICYELTNGKAISQAVHNGAQWILAIANLDPYPYSLQRQFLSIAQLRSIENARDVIVSANTGPSSKISYNGEINSLIPSFKEGIGSSNVYLNQDKTFYVRFGEIPLLLILIIGLLFILN